tara:strand:+ start:8184 stop:8879 length:696 start_codon:yes stop_codon:yes gene_type:complete
MININKKLIFIANPKSGSDTIRTYLKRHGFLSERNFLNKSKFAMVANDLFPGDSAMLRDTLWDTQLEHISCELYKEYLNTHTGFNFDDFKVFSTVRNPWGRYVSAFKYCSNPQKRQTLRSKYKLTVHETFGEYVKEPTFLHTRSFDFMFKDSAGEILCDEFIDMRNISIEVPKFLHAHGLGSGRPVPYQNVSRNRTHYREFYNDETEKIVATRCAEVIEKFGYTFDRGDAS